MKEKKNFKIVKVFSKNDTSVSYLIDLDDFKNIKNPNKWRIYATSTWNGKRWEHWDSPDVEMIRIPAWLLIKMQGEYQKN